MSGFRALLPVWSLVWSPLWVLCSWGLDDELKNTLTRNWQYLNPDEHIFVPLQVPLRTLDLIQTWCRTSKTSSDTVVFSTKDYILWLSSDARRILLQIWGQFSFNFNKTETKITTSRFSPNCLTWFGETFWYLDFFFIFFSVCDWSKSEFTSV